MLHCATAPLPVSYVHLARRAAHSSYTLYPVHLPMLIFLKASLHLPRAYPGWHVYLVGAAVLAAVLFYAQLVYEVFEKNTDRVRRWIRTMSLVRRAAQFNLKHFHVGKGSESLCPPRKSPA